MPRSLTFSFWRWIISLQFGSRTRQRVKTWTVSASVAARRVVE